MASLTNLMRYTILKKVLTHHQRMERDKCSCGRGWLPEAYTYNDHLVAVYEEALRGRKD